jgi:ABC-type antimicrobial peptide transport system permease subunit
VGATPAQIVAVILSRTARHVAIGVLVGAFFGSLFANAFAGGSLRLSLLEGGAFLVAYVSVMLGVCLVAAIVPTRRALAIQPTRALAAE